MLFWWVRKMREWFNSLNVVLKWSQNLHFFHKFFKKCQNHYILCPYFEWNQQGKCIRRSTSQPMFGPVVLEIDCGIITQNVSHFHSYHVLSRKIGATHCLLMLTHNCALKELHASHTKYGWIDVVSNRYHK